MLYLDRIVCIQLELTYIRPFRLFYQHLLEVLNMLFHQSLALIFGDEAILYHPNQHSTFY